MTIGDVLQGAPGSACHYLWNIQGRFKGTPILENCYRSHHLCTPKIVGNSLDDSAQSSFNCWTNTPESVLSPTTSPDTGPTPAYDEKALNGFWDPKKCPLSVMTDTDQPLETLTQRPTDTRGTKRYRNLNTTPQTTPTKEEHLHVIKNYRTKQEHLHVIKNYRTKQCDHGVCRAGTNCPKYHNKGERRRDPRVHRYKPELCPRNGDPDDPSYARNMTELMYHPKLFKMRLCNGKCGKSKHYCAFAHGKEDVFKYEDSWKH